MNVYLDINPVTRKIFYVGVGSAQRCKLLKRNRFHKSIVDALPDKQFLRRVLYTDISDERAYEIEIQIISKCGRICNRSGYLANIHPGGQLEMNRRDDYSHWLKGKKMQDVLGSDYINPRKGKSYTVQYGAIKDNIICRQVSNRIKKIKERRAKYGFTEKELLAQQKTKVRLQNKQFTPRELEVHKNNSISQKGIPMTTRMGDPNYVAWNKGKKMSEICPDHQVWNKGKTITELKGTNFIWPTSRPFEIAINNDQKIRCNNEQDFFAKTRLNGPTLCKLKEIGYHIIKRQKNSKHNFNTGDTLKFEWINSSNE